MVYALLFVIILWWLYLRQPPAGKAGFPSIKPQEITTVQAREILGITDAASQDDMQRAYQELIKKLHPDTGGSRYLTELVITAKKVLDEK